MAGTERTQVVIHGRTYNLAGADPEHTRAIAREVDQTIARFGDALPGAERYQLAILAALHLADESSSAKKELAAYRLRVDESAGRILQAIESGLGQDDAGEESVTQPDAPDPDAAGKSRPPGADAGGTQQSD